MQSTQLYHNAIIPGDVVDRRAPVSLTLGRPLTFASTTDLERNDSEETIVPGTPKATASLGGKSTTGLNLSSFAHLYILQVSIYLIPSRLWQSSASWLTGKA